MHALLLESYDYKVLDEEYVAGTNTRQMVRITYLDLNRLGDATIAPENAIAEELNYQGIDIFIDIFTEEMAMDIAVQALDAVVDNVSDYYVSGEFFISLRYDGNEWKILYNKVLEGMILGIVSTK